MIDNKTIDSVEQIILIEDNVDDSFDLFRIIGFPAATLVKESFAKEIESHGFSGIEFLALDEFDGM